MNHEQIIFILFTIKFCFFFPQNKKTFGFYIIQKKKTNEQ